MPEISRFFGIVIFMNYNDHEPPHFKPKFPFTKPIPSVNLKQKDTLKITKIRKV